MSNVFTNPRGILLLAAIIAGCNSEPSTDGVKRMPSQANDSANREGDDLIRLSEKVFRQLGKVGFDRLNEAQRTFVCIWTLEGEVNNGGFDQFYFNSSGDWARETPDALDKIGARQVATIVRRANAIFSDGLPPKDRERRQQQLDSMPAAVRDSLNEFDSEFYKYPDDLESLLLAFVKSHADQL